MRFILKYIQIIFDQDIDKRVFKEIHFDRDYQMKICAKKMRKNPNITSINLIDTSYATKEKIK
jgi:hypothetical protein